MNQAASAAAPWIERLARLGYASKGLVYTIIGGLTAAAAFGRRGTDSDSNAAFRFILEQPFGRVLILVVALGLLGYAAWRIIAAITDGERRGSDAKGMAIRAGSFFRGVVYVFLTIEAARLAMGGSGGGDSDQSTEHWIARLMAAPFGRWLVVIAGAGVAGYGVYQLYRAWHSKLGKQVRLTWVTAEFKRRIVAISRFGIAARAVVFLLIGYSIARAAWNRSPGEAQGTGESLQQIGAISQWLLAVVAIGLIAYGIYQFVNARYRAIAAV
ncbi:MAG TPA: DUF1206 domain-containing protein [Thermoanaerobaculia bacterium]|nr:DUF1206 domain-containing protein [Thermoanaerobaculia bacterium]